MKIIMQEKGVTVKEFPTQKDAMEYLNISYTRLKSLLESGDIFRGFCLDVATEEKSIKTLPRLGEPVCAYTATTCFRYNSLSACARAYGISRKKLESLIESGATHKDGITTFDIPII